MCYLKLSLCNAAPGLRVNYTDDFTQATYTLNTRTLAFEDAEDICNDIGGHAVSYGGIAEQVAVENFYVSRVRPLLCSSDWLSTF